MAENNIRVRLAPSPTGEVHIGTIWIAFFDWLFARQHGGTFVLRVEDTDQKRLVPGSIDRLLEALHWYGIDPDEGPEQGGDYGPYIQSQRLDHYRAAAEQLVREGRAYYCFCTSQRLKELREKQQRLKQPPRYDKHCATLTKEEVASRQSGGEPVVIRMRLPETGQITHHDLIRGDVTFQLKELDDSVILKSDGFPTYHLAVVVDDHLMRISHVIRAEEWLPSVPKHLWLYQALGWKPPLFAHMPLILGADGAKLSKRHGATSALAFRDQGYLPEAMRNFFVLMGWHPKGDQETLTAAEMLDQFALEDMNPSGAKFDQQKLDWLNGWYIRQLSLDQLLERIGPFWPNPHGETSKRRKAILALVQDRLKTLADVSDLTRTMTKEGWDAQLKDFDATVLVPKKGSSQQARENLEWAVTFLSELPVSKWKADTLKESVIQAIASAGKTNAQVLWPVRVALSLQTASPDVFDLIALYGKGESIRRLQGAIEHLKG